MRKNKAEILGYYIMIENTISLPMYHGLGVQQGAVGMSVLLYDVLGLSSKSSLSGVVSTARSLTHLA